MRSPFSAAPVSRLWWELWGEECQRPQNGGKRNLYHVLLEKGWRQEPQILILIHIFLKREGKA